MEHVSYLCMHFFKTKTFMYFTAVYPYLLMGKYYYYDVSVK